MEFSQAKNIEVLKWGFQKMVVKSLDGILIAELPFLGTPVLRQMMDLALSYVVGKLANAAELQVFFAYTDLRVNQQGRDFVSAAQKHQDILKTGTPEQKAQSEAELFHAFRTLAMIKA